MKPLFSICVITRNEEKTLPRLLTSLNDFIEAGGEVCLMDTGSTDKTVSIANKYKCNVKEVGEIFITEVRNLNGINSKFVATGEQKIVNKGDKYFDYSAARNECAKMAANNFIFWYDADEVSEVMDIEKINKGIENGMQQAEYNFTFAYNNKGEEVIKFIQCKAYDKSVVKWTGIIHEVVTSEQPTKRVFLDESVYKIGHHQNQETGRHRYLTGLAVDCFNNPNNDRHSHYLARELFWSGRPKSALKEFKRHVSMNRWPSEKAESLIFMARIYGILGNPIEQIRCYNEAFYTDPTRNTALVEMAQFYLHNKQNVAATAYAKASLEFKPSGFYGENLENYYKIPNDIISKCSIQIPKKIYTIWLNESNDIPDNIAKCIKSQMINGYEHEIITTDNCPQNIKYINECLDSKSWVKAADYLRVYYLHKYGGIYLDADVEMVASKNFDDLLGEQLFIGMEWANNGLTVLGNAVIGAQKGHPLLERYLTVVNNKFNGYDGKVYESGMEIINIEGVNYQDKMRILPSDYFYPSEITENSICIHHFNNSWKLPKVSIIIPQLGREDGLKRCLDSIEHLDYPKDKIEVLIEEGDETVPIKVAKLLSKTKYDNVVFASNDIEFTPDSLRKAVRLLDAHGLVAFNTGELLLDNGNICEHFIIKKELIDRLGGEIFDTRFNHVGVDNLLWHRASKLGEAARCEDAIIHHYHFSKGESSFDEVYERGWSKVKEDRELLNQEIGIIH